MQSEFMMIDPNELVIDMSVDEAHVQDLMSQLEATGVMLSEVIVWLRDRRIIDGFHRTESARRLRWNQIPCKVFDCTEEEFWDARISSARRHHKVEDGRLAEWMAESWRQSKWYVPGNTDALLSRRGSVAPPGAAAVIKAAWEIWRLPVSSDMTIRLDHPGQLEFLKWAEQKASIWGVSRSELIERLMSWANLIDRNPHFDADDLALKYDLTFEQRQILGLQTGRTGAEYVEDWIQDELISKRIEDMRPLHEFSIETEKEREAERIASAHLEHERWEQWSQTPAGKAQIEKDKAAHNLEVIKDAISRAHASLCSARYIMRYVPETPLLLGQHMEATRQTILEFYPDSEMASEVNPIWLENIALREKIADQAGRIASLERALGSKVNVRDLTQATLALSSVQIEAH